MKQSILCEYKICSTQFFPPLNLVLNSLYFMILTVHSTAVIILAKRTYYFPISLVRGQLGRPPKCMSFDLDSDNSCSMEVYLKANHECEREHGT